MFNYNFSILTISYGILIAFYFPRVKIGTDGF